MCPCSVQHLAVQREARSAIGHQALALGGAHGATQVGLAREAEFALAALGGIQRDHMIARLQAGHARPDRFDNPGAFMPQHRRKQPLRVFAGERVSIGVADAGGDDTHQHLTRLRVLHVDFRQRQGLASLQCDRGA